MARAQLALLENELLAFAAARHGVRWAREGEELFDANYRRQRGDEDLLRKWALFHRRIHGLTLLEEFLSGPDRTVRSEQREVIAAQLGAWASYWEVKSLPGDDQLELRDLLTHERRRVTDARAARTLKPGHTVCTRVLTLPEGALLSGTFPIALRASELLVQNIISHGRAYYGAHSLDGPVLPSRLRADSEPLAIINCWRMMNGLLKDPPVDLPEPVPEPEEDLELLEVLH